MPFFGMIFAPGGEGSSDPVDLRGGARAPRRFIGWQTFFDFGDGKVKPNKRIDTKLSTPLFDLPLGAIPGSDERPPICAAPAQPAPSRNLADCRPGRALPRHMSVPALLRSQDPELELSTALVWILTSPRRSGTTFSRRPSVIRRWPAISDLSAAGSSARSSSGFSSSTAIPICQTILIGGRPFHRGTVR